MNPVQLILPEGVDAYNFLYRSKDPEYLVRDLLTIELPTGFYIDVGWYPEHNPDGHYIIRVFERDWGNQILSPPISTSDFDEMLLIVDRLVDIYNREIVVRPDATNYFISDIDAELIIN